eukprot:CAMPEP_0167741778 /NCGR_PEP_ID=MMETSP0110_2-20121227/1046_1 /TAXON_ID=629695 /ORGANISM="Gymnochlora sp., Strain CCMP2014" /LENGTH=1131 /DNA_ID=CAMNT_0007625869 /DNA_START=197 /DNA_END=3592 /DNA_ORIENTATION=-
MGEKLIRGWEMTDIYCNRCQCVIVRAPENSSKKEHDKGICLACDQNLFLSGNLSKQHSRSIKDQLQEPMMMVRDEICAIEEKHRKPTSKKRWGGKLSQRESLSEVNQKPQKSQVDISVENMETLLAEDNNYELKDLPKMSTKLRKEQEQKKVPVSDEIRKTLSELVKNNMATHIDKARFSQIMSERSVNPRAPSSIHQPPQYPLTPEYLDRPVSDDLRASVREYWEKNADSDYEHRRARAKEVAEAIRKAALRRNSTRKEALTFTEASENILATRSINNRSNSSTNSGKQTREEILSKLGKKLIRDFKLEPPEDVSYTERATNAMTFETNEENNRTTDIETFDDGMGSSDCNSNTFHQTISKTKEVYQFRVGKSKKQLEREEKDVKKYKMPSYDSLEQAQEDVYKKEMRKGIDPTKPRPYPIPIDKKLPLAFEKTFENILKEFPGLQYRNTTHPFDPDPNALNFTDVDEESEPATTNRNFMNDPKRIHNRLQVKGYKPVRESCPECGDVGLMQHDSYSEGKIHRICIQCGAEWLADNPKVKTQTGDSYPSMAVPPNRVTKMTLSEAVSSDNEVDGDQASEKKESSLSEGSDYLLKNISVEEKIDEWEKSYKEREQRYREKSLPEWRIGMPKYTLEDISKSKHPPLHIRPGDIEPITGNTDSESSVESDTNNTLSRDSYRDLRWRIERRVQRKEKLLKGEHIENDLLSTVSVSDALNTPSEGDTTTDTTQRFNPEDHFLVRGNPNDLVQELEIFGKKHRPTSRPSKSPTRTLESYQSLGKQLMSLSKLDIDESMRETIANSLISKYVRNTTKTHKKEGNESIRKIERCHEQSSSSEADPMMKSLYFQRRKNISKREALPRRSSRVELYRRFTKAAKLRKENMRKSEINSSEVLHASVIRDYGRVSKADKEEMEKELKEIDPKILNEAIAKDLERNSIHRDEKLRSDRADMKQNVDSLRWKYIRRTENSAVEQVPMPENFKAINKRVLSNLEKMRTKSTESEKEESESEPVESDGAWKGKNANLLEDAFGSQVREIHSRRPTKTWQRAATHCQQSLKEIMNDPITEEENEKQNSILKTSRTIEEAEKPLVESLSRRGEPEFGKAVLEQKRKEKAQELQQARSWRELYEIYTCT